MGISAPAMSDSLQIPSSVVGVRIYSLVEPVLWCGIVSLVSLRELACEYMPIGSPAGLSGFVGSEPGTELCNRLLPGCVQRLKLAQYA